MTFGSNYLYGFYYCFLLVIGEDHAMAQELYLRGPNLVYILLSIQANTGYSLNDRLTLGFVFKKPLIVG